MTAHSIFKEYIWLANTIRRAEKITFAELSSRWSRTTMSGGQKMSRTTFNRHKDAIEDLFGINIDCDIKNGYKYYISNKSVMHDNSLQNWMLNTMAMHNIIAESMSLQNRIALESSSSADEELLAQMTEAMKRQVCVKVTYKRYGTNESKIHIFEPYCIRFFMLRWYVLGHFHREATEEKPESDFFATFSFDRIENIELTDNEFRIDPSFSIEEYFKDYFGMLTDNSISLERVIIQVYGNERYYLRDLPLHHSQRLIKQAENYDEIHLRLRPTPDFCRQLMMYGGNIRVTAPAWLAQKIKDMHKEAIKMYD